MLATTPNSSLSFCVYCKDVEINDATFRYLEVIRGGLRDAGLRDLGITQKSAILRDANFVVTISCLPAMRAIALNPRAKIVHWFQGIEAVERRFLHKGWRGWGRWVLWSLMERVLLRHARVKLFVSQQMRDFLGDTARPGQASLVIPCYNVSLGDIASSDPDRYRRINMVYAGSMYPWQCVRQSLQAYKAVREIKPDAAMTIFTREVDFARDICSEMGLEDVNIEAVSPTELMERLKEFGFGFILRDAIAINEVSTPTKFSSYLGAGVIPVLTKATPALVAMTSDVPFQITVLAPGDSEAIAERILEVSRAAPRPKDVASSFRTVFDKYFDDALHRRRIVDLVKGL
jgi:hypothetical protein